VVGARAGWRVFGGMVIALRPTWAPTRRTSHVASLPNEQPADGDGMLELARQLAEAAR